MSIEVWGLMPKSQIDPETVEEAITRLIGVHEADPTSHLGENEAIDAHRKSEIIDHLAFSIPVDKAISQDIQYNFNFSSLDGFQKTGTVDLNGTDGITLDVADPTPLSSAIFFYSGYFDTLMKDDSDISFETKVFLEYTSGTFNGSIGFSRLYSTFTSPGFGFHIVSGVLKAVAVRNGTTNSYTLSSIDTRYVHSYRAFYNHSEEKCYYYIDNFLVATVDVPAGGTWDDTEPLIASLQRLTGDEVLMHMLFFNTFRKLITA